MAALKYWLWLATRRGIGNQFRLALLNAMGSPETIYYAGEEAYRLVPGVTKAMLESLADKSLREADRILGDCDRLGIQVLTMQDSLYPERLRNIYDPPILLYVRGRMPCFDDEVAVALVGTRRCTPYGELMAQRLGFDLARQGALVVSGLAEGIDGAAHRGALRAGGFTVAVIGGGHDQKYPAVNRDLYDDIAATGVILSEYPPGTEHKGCHFPVRNRIISGLSLAVLVVEAPARSGALITANAALGQGRDVFAVPGLVGVETSVGCHRLIQEGAGLVMGAEDLLRCYMARFPHRLHPGDIPLPEDLKAIPEEMPCQTPKAAAEETETPLINYRDPKLGLTDDQICVMECLGRRSLLMDDIIEETNIPARRAFSALSVLQVDGYVTKDGPYYRADTP